MNMHLLGSPVETGSTVHAECRFGAFHEWVFEREADGLPGRRLERLNCRL